jgi:hypothetical protein
MIIGVCGLIGAGKDTIADYLVNIHQFRRESFANTLKDAVSSVFGWDRTMLEGRTKQSREWREQRDEWWSNRLGKEITPRLMLQLWGTEVCRKGFHDDIWIASLENKLRNTTDDVVISDCRFPNEIAAIKNAGGIVVCVERGIRPHWINIAVQANKGVVSASKWLADEKIHASETSWIGTEFNAVIDNNAGMDHLYTQVNDLVLNLLASKENQLV